MKRAHVLLTISVVTGCAGLIGVPDLTFDEGAVQGTPDGSSSGDDASGGIDGSSGVDGAPPPPCDETKLATDPSHCGRCGHSCLGGACSAGKCEPVTLVNSIGLPQWIVLDATYAYVSAFIDSAVVRVKRDGTGMVETITSGLDRPVGLAIEGTTLFISDYGSVYKCTLGAAPSSCNITRTVIHKTIAASHLTRASDGTLFLVANGELVRILPNDAGAGMIFDVGNQGWHVATNDNHLYYTSTANNLYRVLLDGGSDEAIGPKNSSERATFVALEGDSYFWSYHDSVGNAGAVYGAKQANTADRTVYAPPGLWPQGIAADATYVYWADRGSLVGDQFSATTGDGKLFACPRAGCGAAPIVLATGLRGGGTIVLDDEAVYFAETNNFNAGGRVRKVAKP